jgi:hypothetical protein
VHEGLYNGRRKINGLISHIFSKQCRSIIIEWLHGHMYALGAMTAVCGISQKFTNLQVRKHPYNWPRRRFDLKMTTTTMRRRRSTWGRLPSSCRCS